MFHLTLRTELSEHKLIGLRLEYMQCGNHVLHGLFNEEVRRHVLVFLVGKIRLSLHFQGVLKRILSPRPSAFHPCPP